MRDRDTENPHAPRMSRQDRSLVDALASIIPAWDQMNHRLQLVHQELISSRGVLRVGADNRQINPAGGKHSFSAGQLLGFSVRETAGAAAVVRVRDGAGTLGDILLTIALAANESARDWFAPHGIGFIHGLYVEIVSGAIEGALFLGPVAP